MKAATASAFGSSQTVLTVATDVPKPKLEDCKDGGKGKLLVRVQACSLSPGDERMLSGDAKLIKKPKSFPYIPGGDICGTVEALGAGVTDFKPGDAVIATWSVFGIGGLAEYAIVDSALTVAKPDSIDPLVGAALANSAGHAVQALKAAGVYEGNRVLILGGSGGVGTCVVQLAKRAGASFVAATSTDAKLLLQLGADRVVDYTSENWWALDEFSERPFDVIIDCAEGAAAWTAAKRTTPSGKRVLSSTGRWLAVVLNDWHIKVTQPWHLPGFMAKPLGRQLSNTLWPFGPRYKMFLGGVDKATLSEVVAMVASGELKVVVDKRGPFAFDEAGVRAAFALLESRHAHGKVVVQISA